jgi:hypothetical protein
MVPRKRNGKYMEKKITIGVLLLVVLIIINAVIVGVLVFFIQDIREPKIDVEFNLSQITTDEMRFTARISMKNDNQFDLLIKNLNIIGKTTDGSIILDIEFIGGSIAAKQQRMFTTNETASFSGNFSSKIYGSIKGIFGVTLAGIFEKTIPFQINITASFQDLFNNISTPKLSLLAEVTEITGEGVLFQGIVNVENPNFFEMSLENFTTSVETEKGESVGVISKLQGKILPNATSQFLFNGTLFYDALNAKILIIRFKGNAGVHVMGIDKTIELSTMAQLPIPDIKELLLHNESLGITISLDVKVRVRGFLTTIGLTLYNPSKLPLQANDLICRIYGLTGGYQKMIAQKSMGPTSVELIEVDHIEAQLLIPYIKIFTSGMKKIFPDWFVIQIEGNFSLVGVNQSIPVFINATINPHFLRS